jgi:transposase
VLWSDECLLKVGQDSRRRRVICQPGISLQDSNLSVSFKSSRVTIMIWACFSGERLGPILTLEQGGIGSEEYMDILYEGLIPMLDDLLNHHDDGTEDPDVIQVRSEYPYIFMQDNAPCHKTPEVLKLLKEVGIRVMKWPPNSPDLNPIEHLWPDLKHQFYVEFCRLRSNPSTSKMSYQKYEEIIHKVWGETSWKLIRSLIESMPRRCQAVIDNKGGATGY